MQSDVRHVLPPPENVAWPYLGSTCANSLPYSPSFHFSLFLSSFFLLCDWFQQAQPDMKTLCAGSTRGRLTIPYGPHERNPETKGHRREQKGPTGACPQVLIIQKNKWRLGPRVEVRVCFHPWPETGKAGSLESLWRVFQSSVLDPTRPYCTLAGRQVRVWECA